jgi:glyoxalase family protein
VKQTVNFDDPGSYHFYFGDARGAPGTILTFFPWPGARRGSRGTGQVEATAFAISPESTRYWLDRLQQHHVPAEKISRRFDQEVIRFADPDGLLLELIASSSSLTSELQHQSPIAAQHSLRGFHSVSLALEGYERTAKLLTDTFGFRFIEQAENRFRFAAPETVSDPGKTIDLLCLPESSAGRVAAGTVHHIAFRCANDDEQRAWREKLLGLGYNVSPIMDRVYFHSIYFREPGGVLFEIATDPPGFTLDEELDSLGESLRLPSWLESARPEIERSLPAINGPVRQT